MKRFLLLSIIISFIAIFFSSSYEAKAQPACPDGFSQKFVQLTVNNCLYDVEICYKCWIGPNSEGDIRVFGFNKVEPNCNQTWDINLVLENIYAQITTYKFIHNNICDEIFPPCDEGGLEITISYYQCWNKENYNGIIVYLPCWSVTPYPTCDQLWKICWRNNDWEITLKQQQFGGDWDSCPTGPEPPDPINDGDRSECFKIHTPCDN